MAVFSIFYVNVFSCRMFSKVTTFLKSRRDSVREVARNTLISMVTTLGPQHLKTLMDGADPILQRGFQVHVYIFTIHSLLVKLVEQGQLVQGSLDPVVHSLVEVIISGRQNFFFSLFRFRRIYHSKNMFSLPR